MSLFYIKIGKTERVNNKMSRTTKFLCLLLTIFSSLIIPGHAYESHNVTLKSLVPTADLNKHLSSPITRFNDCWGYTSPSNRKYGIIGSKQGVIFIEVTDTVNPTIIKGFDGDTVTTWRDIKVFGEYAYVVADDPGADVDIFDLSQIDSGAVTLSHTINTLASHNVAIDIDSGFLYRCGGSGFYSGFEVFDLNTTPGNPPSVGNWSARFFHDMQVVTYTSGPYSGKQIAFCFSPKNGSGGGNTLDILDVTDKNNIRELSRAYYLNGSFSHQGWLSPDKQYLYLGDERDEFDEYVSFTTMRVFDVSDLSAPILVNTFNNGNTAIDHNLYTKDHFIFQAANTSGLRIYDIADQTNPIEVAWFDTYAANDDPTLNGLWSVFPYFDDGIIIGSDRSLGLFVWEFDYNLTAFTSFSKFAILADGWGRTYDINDLIAFSNAWLTTSQWPPPPPPPDPLAEALDSDLSYTTGGDSDWTSFGSGSYFDGDSCESGSILDDEESWLQTTIDGEETVSFWWKVSSESGWDYLKFYIDGVEQAKISGEVAWQQKTYNLTGSGTHTVKWRYVKDGSASSGDDSGSVDYVQWSGAPVPTVPPAN